MLVQLMSLVYGVIATGGTPGPDDRWTDTSPHNVGIVQVNGVRLHYLDWGGTGPTLLFIHGSGSNAHDFDGIAPLLMNKFRVIAMTRRGYGESGRPKTGYDLKTFASDIRGVLNILKIKKVVIAGHSAGGLLVTEFAARYPERVSRVIYLDTTFNGPAVHAIPKQFPAPPYLQASDDDLRSFAAFGRYQTRLLGIWTKAQESSYRHMGHVGAGGMIEWNSSKIASEKTGQILMTARQDYRRVKAKGLYIFATPTAEERFPYLVEQGDSAGLEKARKYNAKHIELRREDVARMKKAHPNWKTIEMPHATHFFFYEQPKTVTKVLGDFILSR